ncbi:MAG: hypothetical protein WB566_09950 [Terriglobales bacterium]
MLREVEELYGIRDRSFTILGIEFREGVPQIWFPGNCKHIAIQIGTGAMNDVNKALFQLAHECVHLLDPVLGGEASVLEEGLATNFSLIYAHRSNPSYETGNAKYDTANRRVEQLLSQHPDAIRHLREGGDRLSGFTVKKLASHCTGLSASEAEGLARQFHTWDGSA